MSEKFDLEHMLREAAEDENTSSSASTKKTASQEDIKKIVTGRSKTSRAHHDSKS